jgi:catechol 2,3-dioxygenase-like lactoylglutathione lyase family enzyme
VSDKGEPPAGIGFQVGELDHVALLVRDVDRSLHWYQEVLGLEHRYQGLWDGVPTMVCSQRSCIALFPAGSRMPEAGGFKHFAFATDRKSFDLAQARLSERGIHWRFEDHGTAHSIYFFDPDGYGIEITTHVPSEAGSGR